jgi:hypothetical protein
MCRHTERTYDHQMAELWAWPPTPTELVAIGTTGAAIFTAWLAWVTRGLARTTRTEVSAQWRPALVPGRTIRPEWSAASQGSLSLYMQRTEYPSIELQGDALIVALSNVGTGPALGIEASLDPGHIKMDPLEDASVILTGEQRSLRFTMTDRRVDHRLIATYRDLGNLKYSTEVDVYFERGVTSTTHEGVLVEGTADFWSFGPVSLRIL